MKFKYAKPFSNGTEYEIFRYNYCDNCKYHKDGEFGLSDYVENGACPIESRIEDARFDIEQFPNVLLEVWFDEKQCMNYHHCPFFTKKRRKRNKEGE